jgi:hypothetical protein
LVAFSTTPEVNTYNEAAGNTSLVFIFTTVEELKIGEVIAITFGYTLPDVAKLNLTVNTV